MKKVVLLLMLLLSLLLWGCGEDADKTVQQPKTHEVTDALGNKMVLPVKPKRIVSMILGADEIVMDLVEPERIIALSYLADDGGISYVDDRSMAIKTKIKNYGAEAILALKPDVVIIPHWWKLNILPTLREMGVKVYVYQTYYKVEEVPKTIQELASVLGEEERGRAIIERYNTKLQDLKTKTAKVKQRKSIITLSGHGVTGKGSMFDDMCRYANIENALGELDSRTAGIVSKEYIIEKNPDYILVPSWLKKGINQKDNSMEDILKDPSLASLKAVKNNQVKTLSGRALFCGSHYVVDSIEELAKTIYPECFE